MLYDYSSSTDIIYCIQYYCIDEFKIKKNIQDKKVARILNA